MKVIITLALFTFYVSVGCKKILMEPFKFVLAKALPRKVVSIDFDYHGGFRLNGDLLTN